MASNFPYSQDNFPRAGDLSYDAAVARAKGTPDPNARGTERIPLDTDARPESPHHTLGWKPHQAAPGFETKKLLDAAGGIPVAFHGSNGSYARPAGALVFWVGAAQPANAEPFDLWYPANVVGG